MENNIIIQAAHGNAITFIFEQSPHLAEVAELKWHTDKVVQKM